MHLITAFPAKSEIENRTEVVIDDSPYWPGGLEKALFEVNIKNWLFI